MEKFSQFTPPSTPPVTAFPIPARPESFNPTFSSLSLLGESKSPFGTLIRQDAPICPGSNCSPKVLSGKQENQIQNQLHPDYPKGLMDLLDHSLAFLFWPVHWGQEPLTTALNRSGLEGLLGEDRPMGAHGEHVRCFSSLVSSIRHLIFCFCLLGTEPRSCLYTLSISLFTFVSETTTWYLPHSFHPLSATIGKKAGFKNCPAFTYTPN